jgi:hypothetical protein
MPVVELDMIGFWSVFVDGEFGEVVSDDSSQTEKGVKDAAFEQNEMRKHSILLSD